MDPGKSGSRKTLILEYMNLGIHGSRNMDSVIKGSRDPRIHEYMDLHGNTWLQKSKDPGIHGSIE